ncbi:MAG TPA: hypothetical protein VGG24_17685, partial [Paraburkholderia sp.]
MQISPRRAGPALTLNQKLTSTIAVLWVGLLAIAAMGIWQTRTAIIEERQRQLSAIIDQAVSAIDRFHTAAEQHTMSEADAKQQAVAVIASLR